MPKKIVGNKFHRTRLDHERIRGVNGSVSSVCQVVSSFEQPNNLIAYLLIFEFADCAAAGSCFRCGAQHLPLCAVACGRMPDGEGNVAIGDSGHGPKQLRQIVMQLVP
jgi:hypothetical protein